MTDTWLAAHLPRLARLLFALQLAAFAFFVAGTHGAFTRMPDPPTTTDFASFYTAGRLANLHRAPDAYDPAAHARAEAAVIAPGVDEKRFLNPPVFLLVCAPLARLPYLPAFILFELATFLPWLWLTTRIAGGGRLAALCLASIPAVWWALGWGQNSFLSASLMAAGGLLLPRRPLLAGAAWGALCFKPHFAVLIPVALLASRQWRAILGAGASVAALCGLTTACFGLPVWAAFLAMARHARQAVESGIQLSGHIDPGGAARLAGLPAPASWALQAAMLLLAAAAVAWIWRRNSPSGPHHATTQAVLVAATLVAMPFLLFYDLVMAGVAAAWLARAARTGGWQPGEPTLLAAAFLASLAAFPSAALLHLAVGALAAPVLLCLALRRTLHERQTLLSDRRLEKSPASV